MAIPQTKDTQPVAEQLHVVEPALEILEEFQIVNSAPSSETISPYGLRVG